MRLMMSAMIVTGLSMLPDAVADKAKAQGMPPEQIKQILDMTKTNWVSFRDWEGQQLIYFTHLEAWKCGIDYVFFGLNGAPLDQMWELDTCNPDNPNAVLKDKPYIELPAGSTQSISVQLIYPDGSKSPVETFQYKPQ
ncbi:MAG: hypothetical protein AAGF82_13835 [Pseudomonadota bacterium]